jgi:hypothetical protein
MVSEQGHHLLPVLRSDHQRRKAEAHEQEAVPAARAAVTSSPLRPQPAPFNTLLPAALPAALIILSCRRKAMLASWGARETWGGEFTTIRARRGIPNGSRVPVSALRRAQPTPGRSCVAPYSASDGKRTAAGAAGCLRLCWAYLRPMPPAMTKTPRTQRTQTNTTHRGGWCGSRSRWPTPEARGHQGRLPRRAHRPQTLASQGNGAISLQTHNCRGLAKAG